MNKFSTSHVIQCVIFSVFLMMFSYYFGKSSNTAVFDKITVKNIEIINEKGDVTGTIKTSNGYCELTFLGEDNTPTVYLYSDKQEAFLDIWNNKSEHVSITSSYILFADNNYNRIVISVDPEDKTSSIALINKNGELVNMLNTLTPFLYTKK